MTSLKADIRAMMVNRSSTPSYSRRSRLSRHSDDTISGSSTPTSNTLRRTARQDRQANRNPLHGNDRRQEQLEEQEHQHHQNQATFAQAKERQCLRQQEEERARQHQDE